MLSFPASTSSVVAADIPSAFAHPETRLLALSAAARWIATKQMDRVVFSCRALEKTFTEAELHPSFETGGVLLGEKRKNTWLIREVCLLPAASRYEPAHFVFDSDYFNREIRNIQKFAGWPLYVLGLWHKHNHAMMPPFSQDDRIANKAFAACNPYGALSVLLQKREQGHDVIAYVIDSTGNQKRAVLMAKGARDWSLRLHRDDCAAL